MQTTGQAVMDAKARRRERIATTAMALFAERGFDAVSVAEVARTAGVAEKTVFNHFATKEDLVYNGDRIFQEQLIGAIRARPLGKSVHDAAAGFLLDLYSGFLSDPARRRRHLVLSQLVSASPSLRSRERLILSRYAEALQEEIAAEQGAGIDDLRPRLAADAIMAAHGAVISAFRRFARAEREPEEYVPEVLRSAAQAFNLLTAGLGSYAVRTTHA